MRSAVQTLTWLATCGLLGACATSPLRTPPPTTLAEVGEIRAGSGYANGYLPRGQAPDSLALLPPPPAPGSAEQAADEAAYQALKAWRQGPRGALAVHDANLKFPAAASVFSCALGVQITEQTTPHLHMLLRRTLVDAGGATYKAKDHYNRVRPFVAFNEPSCTPAEEPQLRKDGSYPSGHSALGWAWALVLTELAPERADALLQRGRAFAQSRGICGVHWKSDIEAGRLVGAAAVARVHSNPVFQAQLAAAQGEIARARAAGQVPSAQACADEAAAVSSSAALAP
ncbi:acid phosphatase [Comamonas serinivorans]|uniref:Acid phosphatase n=1 Tax=Comamonas serinivorans TaxID=1082851 RepID=A0A1Y0EK77_9BURK|nr:phosphatase PAP2 family protein [Comamonas serinivorans]ARU04043.1 acid phosphatase [Comamonas serinivorans]